jgi:hypothetical protein
MSYDFLTTIVVINVIVTFILLQKVGSKAPRPKLKKKAATALWRSDPIKPRHNPPKAAGGHHDIAKHSMTKPRRKAGS